MEDKCGPGFALRSCVRSEGEEHGIAGNATEVDALIWRGATDPASVRRSKAIRRVGTRERLVYALPHAFA